MYTSNYDSGGDDQPQSFRHFRGGSRKQKPGCLNIWGRLAWNQRLMLLFLVMGFCGVWSGIAWMFWPSRAAAEEPLQVATIPALPTSLPIGATPVISGAVPTATVTPTTPLEPSQIAATATFQAAISRPAAYNNPSASPFYVGVVTYEPGCDVSNVGFTTAGRDGEPFYLFFTQPLDRDPLMQMVNVTGYVQQFEGCRHPVIMVQQVFWLQSLGTPAPVEMTGVLSTTVPQWGQVNNPTVTILRPEMLETPAAPVAATATITTWTSSDWTPQPWATADLSGIQNQLDNLRSDINHLNSATATPTKTPTPTATPANANVTGEVIYVSGCSQTNLAISTGPAQQVLLMLSGASLPNNGQPIGYSVLASGQLSAVCGQTALNATSAMWFLPTLTPTPTATNTPLPTSTPHGHLYPRTHRDAHGHPDAHRDAHGHPGAHGDANCCGNRMNLFFYFLARRKQW